MGEYLPTENHLRYEDPYKVSLVVDREGSDEAVVRVVPVSKAHEATLDLMGQFPNACIMQFGGVDLLRHEADGRS